METKFSKGKWKVSTLYNTLLQISADYFDVCEIDCNGDFDAKTGILSPKDEELANANLIAAAPDMYNYLDELKGKLVGNKALEYKKQIELILAKARGE